MEANTLASSQSDMFSSQDTEGMHMPAVQSRHLTDVSNGTRLPLTPATTIAILQPSQEPSDTAKDIPKDTSPRASPQRIFSDSPTYESPLESTSPTPSKSLLQPSPMKRKWSERRDTESDSGPDHQLLKHRRLDSPSETGSSGEDRVFVDYAALTRKDVEISPKQDKRLPLRVANIPPHLSGAAKRITFSTEDISKCGQLGRREGEYSSDADTESSGREDQQKTWWKERRQIGSYGKAGIDTEEEDMSSGQEGKEIAETISPDKQEDKRSEISHVAAESDVDAKKLLSKLRDEVDDDDDDVRMMSDIDDSDVEIIEDKNRSVEVVYEKPKVKMSLDDDIGSQDFSLILSGTQAAEASFSSTASDQRFSEDPLPEGQTSQNLMSLSDSEHLKCDDTLSSSSDEASECPSGKVDTHHNDGIVQRRSNEDKLSSDEVSQRLSEENSEKFVGSLAATQLEMICQPTDHTQPDVEPLIKLPILSSGESQEKRKNIVEDSSMLMELGESQQLESGKKTSALETAGSSQKISAPELADSQITSVQESAKSQKVSDVESARDQMTSVQESASSQKMSLRESLSSEKMSIQGSEPLQHSQRIGRPQMPDVLTPSSQECEGVDESQSVFVKASKAAEERVHAEEKEVEDGKKEEGKSNLTSSSLSESLATAVEKTSAGDESVIDCSIITEPSIDASPLCGIKRAHEAISTPLSSLLQPTQSTRSTPEVNISVPQSSQSAALFGSGKKKAAKTSGNSQESPLVLAEETDSDDEDVMHKKRRKHLVRNDQPLEKQSQLMEIKNEARKTSTPNSQGVSPNLSGEGGSYIAKEHHEGLLSGAEMSKSHNASPEEELAKTSSIRSKSSLDETVSTADTEIIAGTEKSSTLVEFLKAGYQKVRTQILETYIHPETQDAFHVVVDGDNVECVDVEIKANFRLPSEGGSGSSGSSRSKRVSDASSSSRTTGSSGYFGDKSSSSSGSSHRLSMFSTTESSRLSMGSVITLPSPPRGEETSYVKKRREEDNLDIFVVPQVPVVPVSSGRGRQTSQKRTEKSSPSKSQQSLHQDSSSFSSNEEYHTPERRGRGRGRGRGRLRQRGGGRTGRGNAGSGSSLRGSGTPKGKQHPVIGSRVGDEFADLSPEKGSSDGGTKVMPPSLPSEERSVTQLTDPTASGMPAPGSAFSELLSSLPEGVWQILENSQVPLSEEEEEAFVSADSGINLEERQLEHVLKRVREAELHTGLLVFARFTDNTFYSAVLKDRDGTERWHVQFMLDEYTASVREVYLLPTDLLPRGYPCFVRHQVGSYYDPGVVKGHVRVGTTLWHIVQTDTGVTKRVPHSHIFLNNSQANNLLQARLAFRSLVASPGRELSLDNIVAGRRRRTQNERYGSPRSKKADENLDTSEGTAGEAEESSILTGHLSTPKSTSKHSRKGVRIKDLSTLPEETESEIETTPGVGTPKKKSRPPSRKKITTPSSKDSATSAADEAVGVTEFEKDLFAGRLQEQLPTHLSQLTQQSVSATPPKKRGRPAGTSTSSSTQTPTKPLTKLETEPPHPRLGPLPHENSNLFAGYTILLTSGDSSIKRRKDPEEEELPPFDKDYVTSQFIHGGGHVIEKYSEAELILAEQGRAVLLGTVKTKKKNGSSAAATTLLLISNSHCRTAKFIQCLASGVPIVSFMWVITSCSENKKLNWQHFLLPAGERESGELVEQNLVLKAEGEGRAEAPSQVLVGERVFLASSGKPEFNQLWQPLLDTAGAKVRVKPTRTSNLNRVLDRSRSVVVGDPSIPENELERARQLNIPVVSTEWVIQCLIAGKRLPYDAHPKFHLLPNPPTTSKAAEEPKSG